MRPMDTWQKDGKILNIAHRGASGQAPENTIAAFNRALDIGVDAVELDLRRSRDGHLVVIHDETVDRTTDDRGKVANMSLKELRGFDAAARFRSTFPRQQIPAFQEILDLAKGKARIFVELKVDNIEEDVVRTVQQANIVEETVIISFLHQSLKKIKRLNSDISTGLLVGIGRLTRASALGRKARKFGAEAVLPPWNFTTTEMVKELHEDGLFVGVWAVDTPSEMKRLIDMEVDGIATNYPETLKEVLSQDI